MTPPDGALRPTDGPPTTAPRLPEDDRRPPPSTPGGDTGELTAEPSRFDAFAAAISEIFIIPTQCSSHPAPWIATRAALALPLQILGRATSGAIRAPGGEVLVLSIGRTGQLDLLRRLFASEVQLSAAGWRGLWQTGQSPDHRASLIAAEVHPWAAPRFRRAGWMIVPHAVRWEGELTSLPPRVPNHTVSNNLRRLAKRGYGHEVAGRPSDWHEFYTRMLIPHARARFGELAWIPSPALRRAFASRGRILFVKRGAERIAGMCVVANGRKLWVALTGIRDGDPDLLREGAGAAMYALSFEWGRANGFERVDWGRTSPFLKDGVHRCKRNWGLQPVRDPGAQLTALWLDPACEAVRQAFAQQPVFTDTGTEIEVFAG